MFITVGGGKVFHTFGPSKADYTWDGKYNGYLQPQEVYNWALRFVGCPAWIIADGVEGKTNGDITLLR